MLHKMRNVFRYICVKLYHNRSINKSVGEMEFKKSSYYDLDPNPKLLEPDLVHDIIALNICVTLYQNINK